MLCWCAVALPGRSRRSFLVGGATALGVLAAACGDERPPTAARPDTRPADGPPPTGPTPDGQTGLTPADFADVETCTLTPEQIEGPFFLGEDLVRRDITEGLDGHPLRVGIRVLDATCGPLVGAAVDLWHADIDGEYSGFLSGRPGRDRSRGATDTFLRGTQITDDEGIVELATIYPGWYPGRVVHLHTKVRVAESSVLTTQLYFDDARTEQILASGPYAALGRGGPDRTNATDGFAGDPAGDGLLLATRDDGPGTLALAVLAVAP